jgi:hypothetical protein
MGRARVQQVLKYGSWSLPIFVGRSCFDLTPPSNFEAISSRFERFWAILGGFERFCAVVLSAFQHASAYEECPRAGRVKGWVSQPSKYWNIYWYGLGQQVLEKYMESLWRALDGPVMDGADVEKRSKSSQISPSGFKLPIIDCLMLHAGDERALHPNVDAPSELEPFLIQYFQ